MVIEDPTMDPDGPCWCCGSHEPDCGCSHRSWHATGLVCAEHSTHPTDIAEREAHGGIPKTGNKLLDAVNEARGGLPPVPLKGYA